MAKVKRKLSPSEPVQYEPEAIRHFKQAVLSGKHWYIALLEAVRLWDVPEENHNGHTYRYLIDGEALDWLLVAERLCEAVGGMIPEEGKTVFLFHGEPPLKLSAEEFKEFIGRTKHHQYLNYFYGVTVEESLVLVVEEEVRKERLLDGLTKESDVITNEAYRRIYGATRAILLRSFRNEKGYPQLKSVGLSELKEFTYWLFRYRLRHNEKAKIASDTRKALIWLNDQGFARQLARHDFKSHIVIPV